MFTLVFLQLHKHNLFAALAQTSDLNGSASGAENHDISDQESNAESDSERAMDTRADHSEGKRSRPNRSSKQSATTQLDDDSEPSPSPSAANTHDSVSNAAPPSASASPRAVSDAVTPTAAALAVVKPKKRKRSELDQLTDLEENAAQREMLRMKEADAKAAGQEAESPSTSSVGCSPVHV